MARPRIEFSEQDIENIEKLAAVLNQDQLSAFLGCSPRTLRNRITDDERVAAAYQKGRADAIANVGSALLRDALNGNTTAQIFYLKTQAKWSERLELSGPEGGPIETNVSESRERITSRIAGLAARIGTDAGASRLNGNGSGGA